MGRWNEKSPALKILWFWTFATAAGTTHSLFPQKILVISNSTALKPTLSLFSSSGNSCHDDANDGNEEVSGGAGIGSTILIVSDSH